MSQTVKNPLEVQESWVQSLGQEDPWRREWLPPPVFLPGEFHGQRNLAGYSPWGCKESDTTQRLSLTHSCNLTFFVNLFIKGSKLGKYSFFFPSYIGKNLVLPYCVFLFYEFALLLTQSTSFLYFWSPNIWRFFLMTASNPLQH